MAQTKTDALTDALCKALFPQAYKRGYKLVVPLFTTGRKKKCAAKKGGE